ncbi:hypothetical protein GGX14DRAFT_401468 [Mycena pura]|uniref:Uncharacterized protein n=1 Tax=Mycena pura TaxID=153505 RepID=A0AAD6UZR2_9AGAR|nr:hypothetical protein GGX14DRAFT_401468 [Mycena pura]
MIENAHLWRLRTEHARMVLRTRIPAGTSCFPNRRRVMATSAHMGLHMRGWRTAGSGQRVAQATDLAQCGRGQRGAGMGGKKGSGERAATAGGGHGQRAAINVQCSCQQVAAGGDWRAAGGAAGLQSHAAGSVRLIAGSGLEARAVANGQQATGGGRRAASWKPAGSRQRAAGACGGRWVLALCTGHLAVGTGGRRRSSDASGGRQTQVEGSGDRRRRATGRGDGGKQLHGPSRGPLRVTL